MRRIPTLHNAKANTESECAVCYAAHDEEIHAATLRIHQWFCGQVTRHFEDGAIFAPDSQPKPAAS